MILPERNIAPSSLRSDGRPRHRGLIMFIALLILISAAYATWWYLLVEQTREHLDMWLADARTAGHEVSYDNLVITGFPSRIAFDIENFQFIHANARWSVKVPKAEVYVNPWQLDRVEGTIGVPIRIDHKSNDRTHTYTVSSDTNSFDVTLSGAGIFDLQMNELIVAGSTFSKPIAIDVLNATLRGGDGTIFLQTSLNAVGITLSNPEISPFGEKIASLEMDLDIVGRPTRAGSLSEQLDVWRRNGGALEVRRLSVRHGVMGLDGDGTISLDRNLQPEGAFGASVIGFNPAIDALVQKGLVKEPEGRLAKAALGLFAKVPPGGGPKRIDVPLTVQDRKLTLGPFPLMRVPRIYWE